MNTPSKKAKSLQLDSFNLILRTLGRIYRIKRTDMTLLQLKMYPLLSTWIDSEGAQGLKRMKAYYDLLLNWGPTLRTRRTEIQKSLTKSGLFISTVNGYPKSSNFLRKLYGRRRSRTFILAALKCYTLFVLEPDVKLKSITSLYTGDFMPGFDLPEIETACSQLFPKKVFEGDNSM